MDKKCMYAHINIKKWNLSSPASTALNGMSLNSICPRNPKIWQKKRKTGQRSSKTKKNLMDHVCEFLQYCHYEYHTESFYYKRISYFIRLLKIKNIQKIWSSAEIVWFLSHYTGKDNLAAKM